MSTPAFEMSRRGALAGLLAVLLTLTFAAGSRADVFGSISLLSASPFEQMEDAHDPALSEDGKYVVFDGSIGGVTGVWRRSTAPGSPLEQVAGGDAELPSVSEEGRYVSFTTNEGRSLAAITDGLIQEGAPQRESPGVYVRDMDIAADEPGAFTLVSAKDHSSASLTYEYGEGGKIEEERQGATAAGRSAISANGREVAFVTTARSDLAGPGTPPLQVAVRNLKTDETELVSVRYDQATGAPALNPETGEPEPVPEASESGIFGAVYSGGAGPSPFEPRAPLEIPQLPGASISANGTTVAWLGQQVGEQARTLSEEKLDARDAEPLWRRIGDGPGAPTRRVTGGSDPESPECVAHPEGQLPATPSPGDPCQGPFATQDTGGIGIWNNREQADPVPRLSADGNDVAFLAAAPLLSEVGGFGAGAGDLNTDAYWVDMSQPTHTAALRQLTELASGEQNRIATNGPIEDIAISPDGSQVAFTTRRTVFPLGTPAFVSVPAATPGLLELYDADLSNETLTRVTQGYEGGLPAHTHLESINEDPYEHITDGALSPSFSAGPSLVFASTASNLVYGDGNTPDPTEFGTRNDGSDAFLVDREIFPPEPTPQVISAAPANPVPSVPWTWNFSAVSLSNGSVELALELPGSGRLGARTSSALKIRIGRRERVVQRTVADAARTVAQGAANPVRFRLSLLPDYRRLAARSAGLTGTLTVSFTAPGHPTLHGKIRVRFKLRRHASPVRKAA